MSRPWRRSKRKLTAALVLLTGLLVFTYRDLAVFTNVNVKGRTLQLTGDTLQRPSGISVISTDYIPDHMATRVFGTGADGDDVIHDVIHNATTPEKYDLLVNGYMRSGTSFTGRLMSFHPDAFYWYEPMWNYNSGVYYWGPDKVCSNHADQCRSAGKWTPRINLHPHKMQLVLENIYKCNFSTLVPAIAEKMTTIRSGDSWAGYRNCRQQPHNTQAVCAEELQQVCKQAKHRVTKVVRLTVDILEHVLETNPKVKVIHLFRDPRAIINSRTTTDWFRLPVNPGSKYSEIKRNAKDMCARMLYDFRAGIDLKRKYPNRFAFVVYEDLMENMLSRARLLYSYMGADSAYLETNLANVSLPMEGLSLVTQKSTGNFSAWWRTNLKYDVIKIIDVICSDVYEEIGYKIIADQNHTVFDNYSTYSLKEEFLIKNINLNLPYSDTKSSNSLTNHGNS